jgi:hypothetical protein
MFLSHFGRSKLKPLQTPIFLSGNRLYLKGVIFLEQPFLKQQSSSGIRRGQLTIPQSINNAKRSTIPTSTQILAAYRAN